MTTASQTIGRYRWFICTLLFLATTVNYLDRQILSLLKPMLDNELHWSSEDFGRVNAAFQGAYAIGLLLFGVFIDRFGTKIGYAVSIAAWSVAAASHAFAGSVSGFLRARMALGLGEGGNFPSAIKAVALWFPKSERALATALFNSGANVGAILAPATIPAIALKWGWQAAFVAAGIAGFLWIGLWLAFYETPEKAKGLSAAELAHIRAGEAATGIAEPKVSWLSILGYRQAWSFIVAKFLTDPVWWFFLIWLPDYFKKTRSLDIKSSWVHLVSIYAIVTVLSIVGGWFAGYLTKRGMTPTRARKIAMFTFAVLALPIVSVTKVGDWGAVLLIGLAGSAHQAWSANLFTTVSDMFPNRAVASVVGVGGMAGSLGGIFFPVLTGRLLDHFEAAHDITAGYAILFGFCGSAYLIAFVANHLLAPGFAPIRER
ncbi:MAG TPA: MFS transporter [Polyangiaceae bacterium]|jgi:ACS family hexuronate transporter-like MFS transporter|nr:MFS transporter [Polyangiaceae bacterium]